MMAAAGQSPDKRGFMERCLREWLVLLGIFLSLAGAALPAAAGEIPDNVRNLSIAINNADVRVPFGEFIDAALHTQGVETKVELDGGDYLVHIVGRDKLKGTEDDIGMQFTPTNKDVILLRRMTHNEDDVPDDEVSQTFVSILSTLTPPKQANHTTSAPVQSPASSADVQKFIGYANQWTAACNEGSGLQARQACDQRDHWVGLLHAKGWCRGPDTAPESDKNWHPSCPAPAQ